MSSALQSDCSCMTPAICCCIATGSTCWGRHETMRCRIKAAEGSHTLPSRQSTEPTRAHATKGRTAHAQDLLVCRRRSGNGLRSQSRRSAPSSGKSSCSMMMNMRFWCGSVPICPPGTLVQKPCPLRSSLTVFTTAIFRERQPIRASRQARPCADNGTRPRRAGSAFRGGRSRSRNRGVSARP